MSINARIKDLAWGEAYRNVATLARVVGVAKTTLNNCVNGTEPRASLLTAILNGVPDLSAEWLMRGEGPMYRTGKPEAGHTVSGTGNAVGVSAGGSVTVSPASTAEAASLKAEVERLRAVIECKDGEIAFLRGALTASKE